MNGGRTKKCGLSFKICSKILVHLIHLVGKMIPYDTKNVYIFVIIQTVEDHIEHQQEVLQLLKDNLNLAQNRMKQQVDQHRSEIIFDVGDWVFLRLQPYKQMSLNQAKKDNKLSPKYYGPC